MSGKVFFSLFVFVNALRLAVSAACDPGSVVFAPYPGIGAILQAVVVSQVIEGKFIVQWSGSPDLCIHPSNRAQCVVDATESYNASVCSHEILVKLYRVSFVLRR